MRLKRLGLSRKCTRGQLACTFTKKSAVQFPASDDEKQAVHESVRELIESLSKSASLASNLVALLNENFLAISKDYRKKILGSVTEIDASLWHLNLQIHNMNKAKERIIGKPE